MILLTVWISTLLTTFFSSKKHLWTISIIHAFFIALLSIFLLPLHLPYPTTQYLFTDKVSIVLSILTCWLFPLTLIASQSKMSLEPISRQRTYITCLSLLQLTTLMAFMAIDMILFFIFFEAAIIPALILIARWGAQKLRLNAGYTILFFTLLGAIPLIIWMLYFYSSHGFLTPAFSFFLKTPKDMMVYPGIFWLIYNLAFLVKLPLYGVHMWLPKAHVEAPVAGSMILAGTLLKLGGYGMMRLAPLFEDYMINYTVSFMLIAIFGVLATALLCLRQTDLKALVAMSSVSHMNMIVIAVLISTKWSLSGALVMMITHGLTSSALFCLVNTAYERSHTRTMILFRGTLIILPLAGMWWLITIIYNLALPPTPSFLTEIIMMSALQYWSMFAFSMVIATLVLSSAYSLYMYWSAQRGRPPMHSKAMFPFNAREHLLLLLHILPAILFIFKPELILSI